MSKARRARQHDRWRREREGRMSADMPMLVTVEEARAIYRQRQLGNAGEAGRMPAIPAREAGRMPAIPSPEIAS